MYADSPEIKEITVAELRQLRAQNSAHVLVDVRTPKETQVSVIDGSVLIPLQELPQRYGELDPNARIILHCKAGTRSLQAAEFLMERGFHDVASLAGGIDAWSESA